MRRNVIGIVHAIGAVLGGDHEGKFADFLDSIDVDKKVNIHADIDRAKSAGLPVEDN